MFVVTLNYIADLEAIDEAMSRHMAHLRKGFAEGIYLVSGRQIPRVGGVIIATNISREALEERVAQDPFVAEGLAEATIVEFRASTTAPQLKGLLG